LTHRITLIALLLAATTPQPGVAQGGPGEYRLAVDARSARQHLRETDGDPWKGPFIERGSIPLVIRALTTGEDLAQYHSVLANEAMMRQDYTDALAHFQQMAAANPQTRRARPEQDGPYSTSDGFEKQPRLLNACGRGTVVASRPNSSPWPTSRSAEMLKPRRS
jgi:hypothetical protein